MLAQTVIRVARRTVVHTKVRVKVHVTHTRMRRDARTYTRGGSQAVGINHDVNKQD